MTEQHPHIIFATHFSETCYAAIPTVAQWVDSLQARLTLLHVHARGARGEPGPALDSFFAEASGYADCRRELRRGTVDQAIAEFCREHPHALLVMPPSERTGLPRPFHSSLRARVLRRVSTPMLTLPRASLTPRRELPGAHVACWVSGAGKHLDHVREAAALARRRRVELHLLYALPELDEGMLGQSLLDERPLGERSASRWLAELAESLGDDLRIRLHIEVGAPVRVLRSLLQRSQAGLLVVAAEDAMRRGLWGPSIHGALARCPSLLLCVPAQTDAVEAPTACNDAVPSALRYA